MEEEQAGWMWDFSEADISFLGRAGARVKLAYHSREVGDYPELILLSEACKLSLDAARAPKLFETTLQQFLSHVDPIWLALARYIAQRSTAEDRALLIDLAQHPELCEQPLSWGLQYIVRGDILLEDGSVVSLDELATEVSLPCLPYLEQMPEEIDWGFKSPEDLDEDYLIRMFIRSIS